MYELGRAYAANRQMPEAIAALRKAADKGSTSAMVELGVLYGTGSNGVAKDPTQAHDLFERAANAGNPRGVINLVALADNGGPPVDPAKARAMLGRAVETTNSAEAEFQLGLMEANGVGGPKDDAAARALFEAARTLFCSVWASCRSITSARKPFSLRMVLAVLRNPWPVARE